MKDSTLASVLLLPAAVVLLGFEPTPVSGQCTWLTVSGSAFTSITLLDGQYGFQYYYTCNGMYVWNEQISNGYNSIFYAKTYSIFNVTDILVLSGWVIGPAACGSKAFAISGSSGFYGYPYNIPTGTWYELNSTTGTYFLNPNLSVTCSSYLSPGAITGIIIGSICGALILLGIFCACCKSCRFKKDRRTAATVAAATIANQEMGINTPGYPNVAYYASASAQTNAGFSAQPSEFDPANTGGMYGGFTMVQPPPPVYDEIKPPEYDQVATTTTRTQ